MSLGGLSRVTVLEWKRWLRSNTVDWYMYPLSISPNEFGTMRRPAVWLSIAFLLSFCFFSVALDSAFARPAGFAEERMTTTNPEKAIGTKLPAEHTSSRSLVLVASLTVFVLSVFVGFEIIAKVPPTLHTPLMSGSNAISGITVVGAIIAAGYKEFGVGSLLGLVAVVLAMINVVGGFLVTHRMLLMFKKR